MTYPLVGDEERLRLRNRPRDIPVMRQRWRRLALLHWPVDPTSIARLLPPGLQVDTWDGSAYVGLVPFTVSGARPPLLPPVPGLSSFHELNLRTYVHRQGREPGVWFFSLDAASRAAVSLARLAYKLPYHHARMSLRETPEGTVHYASRRDDAQDGAFSAVYAPAGDAAEARAATLPFFLIERYLLYSWDGGRLRSARVWHRPYPIQPATVASLDQDLTVGAGLGVTGRPPFAHYCHQLDVRIYPPHLVAERSPLMAHATPQVAT
jgi:uncharacterized protein YqjF (DUF2071 family)